MNSPGPSDGLMIREDYFTNEKQKFFYQISNKQSGNSFSSGLSNKSSELLKQGTSPFIPQVNYQPTTQGSSSILKSSLEGGNGGFGNFDSHDFNSNRPSRPKIEPFKKFDNLQSARNRNYRLSFDEGQQPLQSQRSFTSLFAPSSIQNPSSLRKASIINDNLNNQVQHQQILEEDQNENQFDMINNPFLPKQGLDFNDSFQKSGFNQLINNKSSSSLHAQEGVNLHQKLASQSPSSNNQLQQQHTHQYLHMLPRKNSTILKNDQECQGRISFGGHNHEPLKRISSCQDMMMLGANGHSFLVDPLFQIDEKKKYIGFLEESDEETSQSDDMLSQSSESDEEEGVMNFMSLIEKYQGRLDKEVQSNAQIVAENNQDNKFYQIEMRREFFHLLQIREIILENNRNKTKQINTLKMGWNKHKKQTTALI